MSKLLHIRGLTFERDPEHIDAATRREVRALLEAAAREVGAEPSSVMTGRTASSALARRVVVLVLVDCGWSLGRIAAGLGQRSRRLVWGVAKTARDDQRALAVAEQLCRQVS